jgi:hypothetical protein
VTGDPENRGIAGCEKQKLRERPTSQPSEEVLGLLTDQARKGSVTPSVALEGLLRHGPPAPIDDVLERLLSNEE